MGDFALTLNNGVEKIFTDARWANAREVETFLMTDFRRHPGYARLGNLVVHTQNIGCIEAVTSEFAATAQAVLDHRYYPQPVREVSAEGYARRPAVVNR